MASERTRRLPASDLQEIEGRIREALNNCPVRLAIVRAGEVAFPSQDWNRVVDPRATFLAFLLSDLLDLCLGRVPPEGGEILKIRLSRAADILEGARVGKRC